MNMLFLILGIVVFVIIIYLFDQRKFRSNLFLGLVLFSNGPDLDIESLFKTSFQKYGSDFSYMEDENSFIVTQAGDKLFMHLQNEQISKDFVESLILSSSGLSYEEINQLKTYQASMVVSTVVDPRKSKDSALLVIRALLVLLKQEGAVGFINSTAKKYYPVRHFDKYMSETVFHPEEFYFLFDIAQNVKR